MFIRDKDLELLLAVDNRGPYVDFGWDTQRNTYARTKERCTMLENFKFQDIFDLIRRV